MIWWILFWVTIAYMKFKVEFSVFQEGHKKISPSIWPLLLNVKSTVKISLILVAFLNNMNFNNYWKHFMTTSLAIQVLWIRCKRQLSVGNYFSFRPIFKKHNKFTSCHTLLLCQSEWLKDQPFLLMHSRYARNLYLPKMKRFF